jgi:hypothetical protein
MQEESKWNSPTAETRRRRALRRCNGDVSQTLGIMDTGPTSTVFSLRLRVSAVKQLWRI